jgi:co-chaperonin GroES (HSP10)
VVARVLDVLELCRHAEGLNPERTLDELYRLVVALAEAVLHRDAEAALQGPVMPPAPRPHLLEEASFRYIPLGKNVLVRRRGTAGFGPPQFATDQRPFEAEVVAVGVDVPVGTGGIAQAVNPGDDVIVPDHMGISIGYEDGPAPRSELLIVYFDNLLVVVQPRELRIHECRRCIECPDEAHHWIENSEFEDAGDPEFECKHCEAVCDSADDADGFAVPDGIARPRSQPRPE